MPDDGVLLARWSRSGDAAAFAELVRRHGGLVYGTCRRIVSDHHAAEDVAQECLLELARKAGSIKASVAGFLHALATNRALDHVRSERARRRRELDAARDERPRDASWAELAPLVDAAVAELPEDERAAIILHFFEGRSQSEVAAELGCGQASVSRRLARGIEDLRARLARSGVVSSNVALAALLGANGATVPPPTFVAAAGKIAVSGIGAGAATGAPLAAKIALALTLAAAAGTGAAVAAHRAAAPRWTHGLPTDPSFFPIGVWYQNPPLAGRYRDAGVNLYYGVWGGPSDDDLAQLAAAGVYAVCDQNEVALRHRDEPTIVGWLGAMQPDDVDDEGRQPRTAASVVARRRELVARDPTRPVFVHFGRGAARDDYEGRGERRDHPEDYGGYAAGGDALSFHCMPPTDVDPATRGNLWFVPRGVDHLRAAGGDAKPVWCVIGTGRASGDEPPTPAQVRAQAWMALIHGARGIVYMPHCFAPAHRTSTTWFEDAPMLAAITALDRQIARLAPALNAPPATDGATVASDAPAVPVDAVTKDVGGERYVFAAAMRDGAATATFAVGAGARADVIDEDRSLAIEGGAFRDRFGPYAVHLYRIVR